MRSFAMILHAQANPLSRPAYWSCYTDIEYSKQMNGMILEQHFAASSISIVVRTSVSV